MIRPGLRPIRPAAIAAALVFSLATSRAAEPTATLLFDSGKEGYRRYRIPALIATPKGTLLAFCEGRKAGGGLTGDIDLVVKSSTDSGKTWQKLEVAVDDGAHTLGNPCPVVDHKTGTIWLALTRSHGADTEEEIVAGTSRETTRVFLTSSTDDGRTWAPPRDISATARKPDWTWYGTGPGIGIQLKSGRLVIPCYHAEAKSKIYRSHVIYSDDHGKTWQRGGTVGTAITESQIAQRADGTLVLSARTLDGTPRRTVALSTDRGDSWADPTRDAALYDPSCQASLLKLGGDGAEAARWLYSHPAGPNGRRNLTVRWSDDEGRTWKPGRTLRAGDSQYSCLAPLPDGGIGCLYEGWVDGNYRVYFARFDLAWLTAPKGP